MFLNSRVHFGHFIERFSENDVKEEPMFRDASPEYAYEHGGPITEAFLQATGREPGLNLLEPVIFDSRVHYLEPGHYPAIPGWHHEDASRYRDGVRGEPNYIDPEYRSFHCMAMVNGQVAPTEFALGVVDFDLPKEHIYAHWSIQVDKEIKKDKLSLWRMPSDQLLWFNDRAWHRASEAVGTGWRWWGRLSYYTNRKPTNTILEETPSYILKDGKVMRV